MKTAPRLATAVLLLTLFLLSGRAAEAGTVTSCAGISAPGTNEVLLFTDWGYGGTCYRLIPSGSETWYISSVSSLGIPNDWISSFWKDCHNHTTMFQHGNFNRDSRGMVLQGMVLQMDWQWLYSPVLAEHGFNDKLSSMIIYANKYPGCP